MEKYINDLGEVGILVSKDYNTEWTTWAGELDNSYLCMDKTIGDMVLSCPFSDEVEEYILKRYWN